MCMNTLSILFVIKIMVNLEIFVTHRSETGFLSNMRSRNQISINVIKVFSSISLVTYWYLKSSSA